MLSNSGVNINDSIQVKNHLNIYYNAQFSYFAYQQVISNCATFAGSYVLPRKGTEADFVESAYRFGFNGKELDPEGMGGGGSTYDYGFRIYNPNLGRFLSVDPLTDDYPWWTPYQFAGNRPIDGIDLDGLEYLDADDARVEFKNGRLQVKVENFLTVNRNAWNAANNNPKNWKPGEIGINPTVANIQFNTQPPQAKDIPGDQLPLLNRDRLPEGTNTQGANRAGKRAVSRGAGVSVPQGRGGQSLARGAAVLDAVNFGIEQYLSWSAAWDISKINSHKDLASKVVEDITRAMDLGIIPPKYQNKEAIVNIMNVVLQGANNTLDPEILKIGMKVYNTISNPPPPTVSVNTAGSTTPTDNTGVVSPQQIIQQ